jgi:hypothetical protein
MSRDDLVRCLWRVISESPAPRLSLEHQRLVKHICQ